MCTTPPTSSPVASTPSSSDVSLLDESEAAGLRYLVELHVALTGSSSAAALLDDWDATLSRCWRVVPVGEVARIERANEGVLGVARSRTKAPADHQLGWGGSNPNAPATRWWTAPVRSCW